MPEEVVMRWMMLVSLLALSVTGCTPAPQVAPGETAVDPGVAPRAEATLPEQSILAAYHWRLGEAMDSEGRRIDALFVPAGSPLQLDFVEGRLAVANTCNRMGAEYAVDGATLQVGRFASTMMACPDEALMGLDREVGRRLEGDLQFAIEPEADAPALVLTDAEGGTLTFAGHATAETRYGSSGDVVFLEVAAQTRPCHHPLIPDMQCLQVREVEHTEHGLRRDTHSEFEHFYEGIEGYAHEPGVRNLLRVKRFRRDPVPADASSVAYVLDMVVESEQVQE